MKRFTFTSEDYWAVDNQNCFEDQSEDYCGPAIDRLAAYENTGLAPEQIPRWISVADQLPEHNQRVIVCRKDGRVEQGFYMGVNGWWKMYGPNTKSITHWMHMPAAPKEVNK